MSMYCGVDLHSQSVQICIINESGAKVKESRLSTDLGLILKVLDAYGPDVQVAVESTNNWYWLVDGLQEAGYDVRLAHTFALKLISQAKVKTDRRDAHKLARLLRIGELPEGYIYPKEQRGLRDLIRRRQKLAWDRARCYQEIRGFMLKHNCNSMSTGELKLLDPADLAKLPFPEETRMYCELVLEKSFLLSGQIQTVEAYLKKRTSHEPMVQTLQGLPGIGPLLAMVIFYETGDITRFISRRHYSSYCRVVPPVSQTGETVHRGPGGKAGNVYLKCAYSQAAVSAVSHYSDIRRFRDRKIGPRPSRLRRLVANCIVAHRLALAAFVLLSEGRLVKWNDRIG